MALKDTPQKNVFIFGCGDIGIRVAHLWQSAGATVTGVIRSEASARRLVQHAITPRVCDLAQAAAEFPSLAPDSIIYYMVPPPVSGQEDTHCQRFLAGLTQQTYAPHQIVVISTTGVYGDRHGERVGEDDSPNPQTDRARRRYHMEQQLQVWCAKREVALVLLRVGGIYGPGRLPLERIRQQQPVLHEQLAPQTNRIHADDLANICRAATTVSHRFRIYNVSDGQDTNMTEYFYTLADYYHLPRPPAVDWATAEQSMSKGMLSYLRESRRVDNRRMLQELGITLQYPDLLAGLTYGM